MSLEQYKEQMKGLTQNLKQADIKSPKEAQWVKI